MEKNINDYTMGEKIGWIIATLESLKEELKTYTIEAKKRMCDCEIRLNDHDKEFANAKGKASVSGAIAGSIAGVLLSGIATYILTHIK